MVKTIYIDILFIVNFIINYLLLFVTANIATLPLSRARLLLSAALGALYASFSFLPYFSFLTLFPIKLFFAFIMVFVSFGKKRILKTYLIFFAVSFAFAGVSLLASFLAPRAFSHISGGVYYIHLSLPTLLISSLLAYFLLHIAFLRRGSDNKKICRVVIRNGDAEISLQALADTGNSLRNKKTNGRIVISDFQSLRPLFSDCDAKILEEHREKGFFLALDKLSEPSRFGLIPYKTVGVPFSLLLTFSPDEIFIDDTLIKNAVCAVSESLVSDGSGYNALI